MTGDRHDLVRRVAAVDRQDRLVTLAESINETGRMARVNVSLTLIGALYLALTLLSAKDENLLRNAVVTLPQFETGISLQLSYLIAPLVFLYLHVQTLFLLVVLARKVGTYEKALARTFGVDIVAKTECRDWLSAVSLVQGLQGAGTFAIGARVLTWIGTVGIPLLLLFLIDSSFLRYQSLWISSIHHVCFSVDLVCVWMFWCRVGSGHSKLRDKRMLKLAIATKVARRWFAILCSVVLVATLWLFAWPKEYHDGINDVVSDGQVQSRMSEDSSLRARVLNFNLFDDLLCKGSLWRGFCRTLDARGATLVRSRIDGGFEGLPEGFDETKVGHYRRIYGIDLTNRSLRFADLENTYLLAAQLSDADLRGARLRGAGLHGANLELAKLHGASLREGELHGANLELAKLHGADLGLAKLHGAGLSGAELVDADLTWAELHGAGLSGAELVDADLRWAELHGANLVGANLHDAKLSRAELVGADLTKANLRGAVLDGVSAVGIEGQPITDEKTTMSDVAWITTSLPQPELCAKGSIPCYLETKEIRFDLRLAWKSDVTLLDHLLDYEASEQPRPTWLPVSVAPDHSGDIAAEPENAIDVPVRIQ